MSFFRFKGPALPAVEVVVLAYGRGGKKRTEYRGL